MFQVVMNKADTQMQGTNEELAKGLCYYIEALNKTDIGLDTIQKICNYAIEELKKGEKEEKIDKVKTIHKEKNFSVYEINTEGMTKEEIIKTVNDVVNKIK